MPIAPMARAAVLAVAVSVVASCRIAEDPVGMPCSDWLNLPSSQRIALTSQTVGTSDDGLSRIRTVAARGGVDIGTQDALVAWVEASVTKNCEFWPPRTRSVRATYEALYP